jgi:hypothetical protein
VRAQRSPSAVLENRLRRPLCESLAEALAKQAALSSPADVRAAAAAAAPCA